MIGRRAIVGLSLLSALLFCAFAASSASADTGTTAFTCVSNPEHEGDWEDSHCTTENPSETGGFSHKAISVNPTFFKVTNNPQTITETAANHATLKGTLGGVASEITCATVSGHGTLENKLSGTVHSVSGSGTVDYTNCTMPKPVNGEGKERCKVKEPIKFNAKASSTEMGMLFSPPEGTTFVSLEFEEGPGTKCPVAGKAVPVTGSAEATPHGEPTGHGATLVFTNAMTKGTKCGEPTQTGVCLGGVPAEFSSTIVFQMAQTTEGAAENPIALTTPPFKEN